MTRSVFVIKECFYSLQGEGVRAGQPSVFLRFAGCNLNCNKLEHGFDCDTDFAHGTRMELLSVLDLVEQTASDTENGRCEWVILTGGEPALQATDDLLLALQRAGFKIAIETNGTVELNNELYDWICVSPKTGDVGLKQHEADEVKFVVAAGDSVPVTSVRADHYIISPACEVVNKNDPENSGSIPEANLKHCINLCLAHPQWRLSEQHHKRWRLR